MGNMCLHDDSKEIPIKKHCYKCGDCFKIDSGGYSQRRQCRFHNFKDGVCIDCRSDIKTQERMLSREKLFYLGPFMLIIGI